MLFSRKCSVGRKTMSVEALKNAYTYYDGGCTCRASLITMCVDSSGDQVPTLFCSTMIQSWPSKPSRFHSEPSGPAAETAAIDFEVSLFKRLGHIADALVPKLFDQLRPPVYSTNVRIN